MPQAEPGLALGRRQPIRAAGVASGMDFTIFVVGILAIYFIPTIVAWGKPQVRSVFLLNLFLGWSLIGWIIALLWALYRDDRRPRLATIRAPTRDPRSGDPYDPHAARGWR